MEQMERLEANGMYIVWFNLVTNAYGYSCIVYAQLLL